MYKCIKSFTTGRRVSYYYGNTIPYYEYNDLNDYEKKNFELVIEEKQPMTKQGAKDKVAEYARAKRRQEEEDERNRRQRAEEEEDRRRRQQDEDNLRLSTFYSNDSYTPPSYDPPSNDSDRTPDYGGGTSEGGGSTGEY